MDEQASRAWNPSKHPRVEKGSAGGGQFAPASGGAKGAKDTRATPSNARPVGTGETGQRVHDLQQRLNALGAHLAVDGIFGPKTRAAVEAFQKAHGLKPDGLVGPLTTAALRQNHSGHHHKAAHHATHHHAKAKAGTVKPAAPKPVAKPAVKKAPVKPAPQVKPAARTAQTAEASTVHHPIGKPGGPGLWHTGKQLPAYIQNVAKHLIPVHGESKGIAMAVGIVKNWAAGHDGHGNRIHPDVQAAATKAIAEWEKLRGEAHAKRDDSAERAGKWKHDYIPLDYAAAQSKFHGRVPEGWHPSSGGAGKPYDGKKRLKPGEHHVIASGEHEGVHWQHVARGHEPGTSRGPRSLDTLADPNTHHLVLTYKGHTKEDFARPGVSAQQAATEFRQQVNSTDYEALAKHGELNKQLRLLGKERAKARRSAPMNNGDCDQDGLDSSWDGNHDDLPDLADLDVADLEAAAGDTPHAASRAMPKLGTGKRFANLKSSLAKKGAKNPGALAAYIGRKKFGKKKFHALASAARKRKGGASRMAAATELMRIYPLEDIHILTRAEGDGTGRVVEAYATVFDQEAEIRDHEGHYKEVIDRGAFDQVLGHIARTPGGLPAHVKVLFNHGRTVGGAEAPEFQLPLGKPLDVRPEARGLLTRTEYDAGDPFTERVLAKIHAGTITAQSFVGGIIRSSPELRGPGDRHRARNGVLTTVRRMTLGLREYGPVLYPAYSGAEILGVRMSLPGSFEDDPALDEPDTTGEDDAPDGGDVTGDTPEEVSPTRDHAHRLLVMRTAQMCRDAGIAPLKGWAS